MMQQTDFDKFRKILTTIEREMDRRAGALKQTEETLKKDFNIKSIKEGKKKLKKLRKKQNELEKKFRKQVGKFYRENRKHLKSIKGVNIKVLRAMALPLKDTKEGKSKRKKDQKRNKGN